MEVPLTLQLKSSNVFMRAIQLRIQKIESSTINLIDLHATIKSI